MNDDFSPGALAAGTWHHGRIGTWYFPMELDGKKIEATRAFRLTEALHCR